MIQVPGGVSLARAATSAAISSGDSHSSSRMVASLAPDSSMWTWLSNRPGMTAGRPARCAAVAGPARVAISASVADGDEAAVFDRHGLTPMGPRRRACRCAACQDQIGRDGPVIIALPLSRCSLVTCGPGGTERMSSKPAGCSMLGNFSAAGRAASDVTAICSRGRSATSLVKRSGSAR